MLLFSSSSFAAIRRITRVLQYMFCEFDDLLRDFQAEASPYFRRNCSCYWNLWRRGASWGATEAPPKVVRIPWIFIELFSVLLLHFIRYFVTYCVYFHD